MEENSSLPSVLTIENSIWAFTTEGLIATSRGRGWNGITYDLYGLAKNVDLTTPPVDHHALAYCIEGSGRCWQRRGGRTHESVLRTGSLIVMPAGESRAWRGTAPPSVRVRFPKTLLAEAAMETATNPGRMPELLDVFHARDLLIGQLAGILVSELERPEHPAQPLIIESISYALVGHLLRNYDAFTRNDIKIAGLGPRALSCVMSYIEDHSHGPIKLDALAGIANASRFHFARMFKLSVGVSPMTYVERSRIHKAQVLIRAGELSLAAVGLAVGFADQSHFTRRFRVHVGCTPSHYASRVCIDRSRPIGRGSSLPIAMTLEHADIQPLAR